MKSVLFFALGAVFCICFSNFHLISQTMPVQTHGVAAAWGQEFAVPRVSASASARGVLGNNMAFDNTGKIVLFYVEQTGNRSTTYITTSTDGGRTWTRAVEFTPITRTVGGSAPNMAIGPDNSVHVAWNARQPQGVFYSKLSPSLQVLIDTVRVGSSNKAPGFAIPSVDRKNRVHITWFEGDPNNTTNPAEIFYNRSVNGGTTWETARMLSANDNKQSAYARMDASGTEGDALCVAWRDSVGGMSTWDVVGVVSIDGGRTWGQPITIAGGTGRQWDPGVTVDKRGEFHVNYHEYPPVNQINTTIKYSKSTDGGRIWTTPVQVNRLNEPAQLTTYNYDYDNDTHWIFWKDERDVLQGGAADLIVSSLSPRASAWSAPEFVTDWGDWEVGFKGTSVFRGVAAINYEVLEKNSDPAKFSLYYRQRTMLATSVKETMTAQEHRRLQVSPNPASELIFVKFTLAQSERVSLKIFNALGQELASVLDAELPAGEHSIPVSVQPFSSSLLFVRLIPQHSSANTVPIQVLR
jgi:hypothetical protein